MNTINLDDFTRYSYLSGITHAPDGKHACFAVHQADLAGNRYRSNLWLLAVDEERYYQLTAFDGESSFLWLDNAHILFPSVRDAADQRRKDEGEEFTQYYTINIHGGEAVKSLRIPRLVTELERLADNDYLFLADYRPGQPDWGSLSEAGQAAAIAARKAAADYEVLEEIPFWANGEGFTSYKRQRLYRYQADLERIEPITDELTQVDSLTISRDKRQAALIANRFESKMPSGNQLLLYDIATGKLKPLADSCGNRYDSAHWLADGSLLFTAAEMREYGINATARFYRLTAGAAPQPLTPSLDISLGNSLNSDCRYGSSRLEQADQNAVYFISTEKDRCWLNRIDNGGRIEKLIAGGSIDGLSVSAGRILFIGMSRLQPQEIYSIDGEAARQLSRFNAWLPQQRAVAAAEPVSTVAADGETVEGWVIKPPGFTPAQTYPAILVIHGGPRTAYGDAFIHDLQYWAGCGYILFFCNPRGSDGRGNAYADIRGRYGSIDYDDLMRFTDTVLERFPGIDRERLGVTGGSYGGFMTNWIIGHSDRFRAAASERGIANWLSKFCTTDIGYYFVDDQIDATPWSNADKLWAHSPLAYAGSVKTPTLFIHAEEDYRCWLAEGLQMFTALKYHGVEARFCLFKGENHDLSRSGKPQHRLRRITELSQWFERYLKPQPTPLPPG
ncbi:MAG: S9 family peptidase [Sporomusaceae bacterium]|nr:S9 family peptidase [Sporomusaceae bacterium]